MTSKAIMEKPRECVYKDMRVVCANYKGDAGL